jgi:RNA polymerase sigma-70 factor (ECF subfamily)
MTRARSSPPDPEEEPAVAPEVPPAARTVEDPDEADLIRKAQTGDEQAFETLVRRHQRRAQGIARSLVPGEEDARDLAQEAFLRVFRNLDRFDFQHPFATWLHRIVTNLAIDHLRKRRLVLRSATADGDDDEPEIDVVDEAQPAPSQRLEASETAARVREVIDALAPHFQTVLVLRELQGLPCTEIAEIVGATHVTVRWRLHRGRKLFQEEWERRQRADSRPAGASSADPDAGHDVLTPSPGGRLPSRSRSHPVPGTDPRS